jgi:hypothetical protein
MTRLFGPDDESIVQIHEQLAHLATIMTAPFGPVQVLSREQLSALVSTVFWASMRSNEGRTTRVRVTVAAPEDFQGAITFAEPVAYEESQIAKLAPAVPGGGCLIVSASGEGFNIRGFGRAWQGSRDTVSLDVSEPGTVRVDIGVHRPFAIINGRSNPLIGGTGSDLGHHLQKILQKKFPADGDYAETQAVFGECMALADLARVILARGHGGMVLIVPSEAGGWSEYLNPFAYQLTPPDTAMRDAIRLDLSLGRAKGEMLQHLWATDLSDEFKHLVAAATKQRSGDVERAVRTIASLAAVDGAIVVTKEMRVLGFGAKIAAATGSAPQVCILGPKYLRPVAAPSSLEDLGGTRHQSAARFVALNKDAVALVISQDRHMSVLHWEDSVSSLVAIRDAQWLV